jgi:hypothetical protein
LISPDFISYSYAYNTTKNTVCESIRRILKELAERGMRGREGDGVEGGKREREREREREKNTHKSYSFRYNPCYALL